MKNLIKIFLFLSIFNIYSFANSVKIVLIERVSQFIEWPVLPNYFKIGIYQNEEVKKEMEALYKDKTIQGLPIVIKSIKNESDIHSNNPNLIYFPQGIPTNFDALVKKIRKSPILFVSDLTNDVNENVHLSFYFEDKKIKFIVNTVLLENSHLKASYKLLKLAKIVEKNNQ